MKRTKLFFLLPLLPASLWGQGQGPVILPSVDRALARRGTAIVWVFGDRDTPPERIANTVSAAGGTVRFHSRWLHAVSAELTREALSALRNDRDLLRIQPVARYGHAPEPPARQVLFYGGGAPAADSAYGGAATALERLNVFPLIARGARGRGLRIALLDTGFETGLPAFSGALIVAASDFVNGDAVVANEPGDPAGQSAHGTQVWSLLAADVPGTMVGVAPEAAYLLAKVDDIASETRLDEDRWVAAVEWAEANGADIINSSVNYLNFDGGFSYAPEDLNGDIAITTVVADSAAARGITLVVAAGNLGPGYRSLMTPADADSVITVGAEDTLGTVASFSSRGPTADARLKPDLVAPGVGVLVLGQDGMPQRASGTSFAAPLVAGSIALMREFQPALGSSELLQSLRATGDNRSIPDSARGWGRPDVAAATYFPRGVMVTTTGDSVLTSITPTFTVTAPMAASVAAPFTHRVRIARDSSMTFVLLDTSIVASAVPLLDALAPGDSAYVEATIIASDSVSFTSLPIGPFVGPAWVGLTTLSNPAGSTVQSRRPTFEWTSPDVAEPPGPFVYNVEVFRSDNQEVVAQGRGLVDRQFIPTVDLERNTPYRWRVIAFVGADSIVVESDGTFIVTDNSTPTVTLLFQNFPNPFPNMQVGRTATCMWFDLATAGEVRLDILDIRGLVVRTLIPGNGFSGQLPAGRYGRPDGVPGPCDPNLEWDGLATDGSDLPRGLYLLRLVTPDGTFFKRIVFMGRSFG